MAPRRKVNREKKAEKPTPEVEAEVVPIVGEAEKVGVARREARHKLIADNTPPERPFVSEEAKRAF